MPRPLRLLLIEDEEHEAQLLLRELAQFGYDVTWERVRTSEEFVAALQGPRWDAIVSEFRLPGFSGLEALSVCREHGVELPFIIVSATLGDEDALDSMRLGAHDFVVKGRLARLGPAIQRGLRVFAERKALRGAEARLRQSEKMEAIGQLAGGVAHDFNNLLGVIQGYGELLLRELPAQDRQHARVNQILRAAGKGAALTRHLLAFSRRQPLATRSVDLNAVVYEIETTFRRLVAENIQIDIAPSAGLYPVKVDPTQIEQVLMNLLINARDAMADGGRLVVETSNVDLDAAYVRSHPDVEPGAYALLAVSDTGHGMDAETVAHAFEPFFTTKAAGQGIGLGLSTAYGIVRQSRGHIAAYSEPGLGSTFKVYLPKATDTREGLATLPREPPGRGTETVLLVEDEESVRVAVHGLLEQGGYTVIDGPDPEASLAAAEQYPSPIHLLLTDLVMPQMSGHEAAARLRATRADVKVLYMSGYTRAAAEQVGRLEPPQAFIQKPFSLDALLRKMRELLDPPQWPPAS